MVWNAYMYLRKSRQDDAGESVEDTLRRHDDTLRDFAHKNHIHIIGVYKEVVSGDSLYARTEMLRLLQDIEKGKANAVLCMDIDRLGRGSMSDQGIILDALKNNDIRIITPRKLYDLNDELDEEYTEFETFLARRELKSIKRRLQRGIRKTIEEGGYIANAPYGYRKATEGKKPTLKIHEEEAAIVRMIFDLYVNHGMGCQSIADMVNAMGAKPHRSDAFGRTSIMHILKNPVFCGKVAWDRKKHIRKGSRGNEKHITIYNPADQWLVVDGIHEPIVSVELWEKAQDIIRGRYHPPYNKGIARSPLAGVVKCRECGRTMVRVPFSSKNRESGMDSLICPTRSCCASTRLDRVENAILSILQNQLKAYQAKRLSMDNSHQEPYAKAAASIRADLHTLQGQLDKLHDLLEQGVYDVDTFLARSDAIKRRKQELQASLAKAEEMATKNSMQHILKRIEALENGLSLYSQGTVEEKNQILRKLIDKAVYFKPKGSAPTEFSIELTLK